MTTRRAELRRSLGPLALVLLLVVSTDISQPGLASAASSEGQITWAVHTTLVPAWFDPVDMPGVITPFMVLYALHDAVVKSMPGKSMAPSLAESWSVSPDGLVYEFVLRKGVRFHNSDPLTADDVKFSFERYRGVSAKLLKDKVAAVEVSDPARVRFRLKQPRPDFMTFYRAQVAAAGFFRRSTSRRSATKGSRRPRSAPAPTSSCRSHPASSSSSKRSTSTGGRRRP